MNIRKYREAAGLTKSDLAKKMRVSLPTVSRWEAGTDYPAAARLPALARALDCSIDDLFADESFVRPRPGHDLIVSDRLPPL